MLRPRYGIGMRQAAALLLVPDTYIFKKSRKRQGAAQSRLFNIRITLLRKSVVKGTM